MLAYKFNEPNVKLVNEIDDENDDEEQAASKDSKGKKNRRGIMSTFRMSKKSETIFAAVLGWLATEWSLGPKELFAAEFGVFVALEFKLHATPTQVAFHFKILMDSLEKRPLAYLGPEMFVQWQNSLDAENRHRERKERRLQIRQELQDKKIIELQLAAQKESEQQLLMSTNGGEGETSEPNNFDDDTQGDSSAHFESSSGFESGQTSGQGGLSPMRSQSKDNKAKSLLQKLLMRKSNNLSAKSGDEEEIRDLDHVVINIEPDPPHDQGEEEEEANEESNLLKDQEEREPLHEI